MKTPDTNIWIRNFAWRAFRDAADEDYLLARQSARYGLHYQFYWNAEQAVEKYLKCTLLLNGRSVKKFSHNIAEPFSIVQNDIAPDLIPSLYCPPSYFRRNKFHKRFFEPFSDIVSRFNEFGDPMQRYRTLGTEHALDDLHKFDELVFVLRRICFPLDMKVESTEDTFRELLMKNYRFQPHEKFSFYDIYKKKKARKEIFEAHSWQNFSFFENRSIRMKTHNPGGIGFTNSALNMLVANTDDERINALEWVLENTRLRTDLVAEIKTHLKDTRA